jgi:hypothetical protein
MSERQLIAEAIAAVGKRLPASWKLTRSVGAEQGRGVDAIAEIRAPNGATSVCLFEAKNQIVPRDVSWSVRQLKNLARQWPNQQVTPILVSRFLSPRTRERLEEEGIGYVDLAGNIRLVGESPALFLYERSADRSPWPDERPTRYLRGPKAGRVVRALCDYRPPRGVRELAMKTGTDAGYVSRVIALLEREDLVSRLRRGPITQVDWPALIRRWAQDYSPMVSERMTPCLAPRGVTTLLERLRTSSLRYAVTGSFAASKFAPVAAPRLITCYVDERANAISTLELRATDSGANVLLVEPFDSVVYERVMKRDDVTLAALSQVAADLFTGPGRSPAEADALLRWMGENEDVWRS